MPCPRHTVPLASMLQWYLHRCRWNDQHNIVAETRRTRASSTSAAAVSLDSRWGTCPILQRHNTMQPSIKLPRVPYLESEGATFVPACCKPTSGTLAVGNKLLSQASCGLPIGPAKATCKTLHGTAEWIHSAKCRSSATASQWNKSESTNSISQVP